MSLWYRVFSALDTIPDAAGLQACLAGLGPVRCSFSGDEAGWYRADVAAGSGAGSWSGGGVSTS